MCEVMDKFKDSVINGVDLTKEDYADIIRVSNQDIDKLEAYLKNIREELRAS